MTAIEQPLAEFVLGTQWSALPAAVRDRAVDLFVDAVACAYTGRRAAGREGFASALSSLTGPGDHSVVGDRAGSSLLAAGMLNAWQVTATTMCDVYRPAMCHVTPLTLSASLAGADDAEATMGDVLTAFAVGTELTVRLCAAMDQPLYRGPRWHAPGVIGPFGSAATYGRLAGLDIEHLRTAWGAALLNSAGTFSAIGTPGVKLTQARGAAAGIQSVVFAAAGHGASPDAFAHPDGGLFDAYAGGDASTALEGLGDEWMWAQLSLRRWPASSSLQSLIAAVLELRAAVPDADPAALVVELPPQSYKLCGTMPWDGQLSALQSASWVAASTWVDGMCWVDQFEPPALAEPQRTTIARSIQVRRAEDLPEGASRVRIGSAVVERIHAPGSPADPLGRDAIRSKLSLAAGAERTAALLAVLDGDSSAPADDLLTVLREDAA